MNIERMRSLAKISEGKTKQEPKVLEKKGSLAVVLEGQYYYIKKLMNGKYDYILGEANKTKGYVYSNASDATRNLQLMSESMVFGHGFKNEADEAPEEDAPTPEAEAPAPKEDAPAPEAEAPAEDAPSEDAPAEAPAPEAEGGSEGGDEDMSWLDDVDAEGGEEGAPAEDAPAPEGDDSEGESLSPMEAAGKVQSLLSSVDSGGAQEAYNALAQVLTAVDDSLVALMTPEDKAKAGKKFQEMADRYAPKEESRKYSKKPMAESRSKKPFDKLDEREINRLIESSGVMEKPSIKRKLRKLEEMKRKGNLLESKISKKKMTEDRESIKALGDKYKNRGHRNKFSYEAVLTTSESPSQRTIENLRGTRYGSSTGDFTIDHIYDDNGKFMVEGSYTYYVQGANMDNLYDALYESFPLKIEELDITKFKRKMGKYKFDYESGVRATDPTKSQMLSFLKKEPSVKLDMEHADKFDIEEAIYWFAHDYHEGQNSNLYSVVSTSKYKPGVMTKGIRKAENPVAEALYDALVDKFSK